MNFVSPKPAARGYHALVPMLQFLGAEKVGWREVFVPLHGKCSGLDFVRCPSAQAHLSCIVTLPVAGQRVPK